MKKNDDDIEPTRWNEINHLVSALVKTSCTLGSHKSKSFSNLKRRKNGENRKIQRSGKKDSVDQIKDGRTSTPFNQLRRKTIEAEAFDYQAEALKRFFVNDSAQKRGYCLTRDIYTNRRRILESQWWERLHKNQCLGKTLEVPHLQRHYKYEIGSPAEEKEERKAVIRQHILELEWNNAHPYSHLFEQQGFSDHIDSETETNDGTNLTDLIAKRKKERITSRQLRQSNCLQKQSELRIKAAKHRHELHKAEVESWLSEQERIQNLRDKHFKPCLDSEAEKGLQMMKSKIKAMENGYLLFSDQIYQKIETR